jgi:hypothetical protein
MLMKQDEMSQEYIQKDSYFLNYNMYINFETKIFYLKVDVVGEDDL